MREKPLPIGKTLKIQHGNCTVMYHVVRYNERSGHNEWEEKFRRYEDNHY